MSAGVEMDLENLENSSLAPEPPEETPQQESWINSHLRELALVAGAVALVTIASLYWYYHGRESTDDAQVDGDITPIASKIYGNVAEVLVNDNERVKEGQLLVRIDPRDAQAAVDQARAKLTLAESQARAAGVNVPWTAETTASGQSSADANLARAQAAYDQARTADIAYARANVEKSRANADLARANLERMKPLAEKEEISKQQFDAVQAEARVAESTLQADLEKLAQAQRNVEITRAMLEVAQANVGTAHANLRQVNVRKADEQGAIASVQQARAALDAAELQLSYTKILAPSDGVVTHKQVEPGQIVQPGQGLMVIAPLEKVWVTANFKETQLAKMHPGQKAYVDVDTYGETFSGHVDSIAGATGARLSLLPPENATGNYVKVVQRIPVKIVLDPIPADKAILRPGMNVGATVMTK
jgi:membrane fusion protein (multidrug efflux system)